MTNRPETTTEKLQDYEFNADGELGCESALIYLIETTRRELEQATVNRKKAHKFAIQFAMKHGYEDCITLNESRFLTRMSRTGGTRRAIPTGF